MCKILTVAYVSIQYASSLYLQISYFFNILKMTLARPVAKINYEYDNVGLSG